MKISPSDDNFNARASLSENSSREVPRLPRETIPVRPASPHETSPLREHDLTPRPHHIAVIGALVAMTCLFIGFIAYQMGKRATPATVIAPVTNRVLVAKPIVVHVAGGVKKPGVYSLNSGARIADALQKAGGATKEANTDALNLAATAQDGTKIEVPLKPRANPRLVTKPAPFETRSQNQSFPDNETADSAPPKTKAPTSSATPEVAAELPFASAKAAAKKPRLRIADATSTRSSNAPPKQEKKPRLTAKPRAKKEKSKTIAGLPRALTPSGELSNNASTEFLTKHPLDLNRITREQLEALPDVGPSLAERILAYRKENGGFKNVAELDNVKGIGEKKLETLLPLLRVEGEVNTAAPTITSAPAEEN